MRVFFAVALPDAVRERLAALVAELRDKAAAAPVSWVVPENFHLTLRFLGDATDERVLELQAAAAAVAARTSPFRLVLEGLGTFGGRVVPRVVWVGARDDDGFAALAALAAELEDACVALGFPAEERAFKAHATLARVRDERGGKRTRPEALAGLVKAIDARREFAAGEVVVDRVVLYESRLHGSRQPEYVEAGSFTLSAKKE